MFEAKKPKSRLARLTSFARFYFWKKLLSLRLLSCPPQPQYIHKVLKVTPNVSYTGSRTTQISNSLQLSIKITSTDPFVCQEKPPLLCSDALLPVISLVTQNTDKFPGFIV